MSQDTEEKLDKLMDVIYGNGRDGLIERTVRIEDAVNEIKEDIVTIREEQRQADERRNEEKKDSQSFRIILTKELGEIKGLIVAHHVDKDLHTFKGLVMKKDIIIFLVLVFIFLHSVLPPELSLWETIKKLIGI